MATSVVFPRVQFFADNGRLLIGGRIHTYIAGTSSRAPTYKDAARAQPNTNPIILDGRAEASIYLAEGVEYKFVVEDSNGALIMTQEPVYGAIWPNAEDWPSDATLAYQYMLEAKAAASAIGPIKFYDTYAQADGDLPNLSEDDLVEIAQDETRASSPRARYRVESGALVFVIEFEIFYPNLPDSVPRLMQSKLRESVSVKDFGAVGDGVTDDTAAIRLALSSTSISIYFPPGDYRIVDANQDGTPVLVSSVMNRVLFGPGRITATAAVYKALEVSGNNSSIHLHFHGNNQIMIALVVTGDGCDVSGSSFFDLFAPANTYTAVGVHADFDGTSSGDKSILITGNSFRNIQAVGDGIGGNGVGLSRAVLLSGDQDIIKTSIISNNIIIGVTGEEGDAIAVISSNGSAFLDFPVLISGNTVTTWTRRAVKIQSNKATISGNTFRNTQSSAPSSIQHAVSLVQGGDHVVDGNVFTSCRYAGQVVAIASSPLERVDNITITGNVVRDIGAETTSVPFFVQSYGANVTIAGNQILCPNLAATRNITVANALSGYVAGNYIQSATSTPYSFTGSINLLLDIASSNNNTWGERTLSDSGDAFGINVFGTTNRSLTLYNWDTTLSNAEIVSQIRFHQNDTEAPDAVHASIRAVAVGTSGALALTFHTGSSATADQERLRIDPNGVLTPGIDNSQNFGSASFRWNTIFAGTGAINTSDARDKQQVRGLFESERVVAGRLKSLIRSFKFSDAVMMKGEQARIHFGVVAQEVRDAFVSEGLDPEKYALFCYDTWDETQREEDEEGNIIQEYRPAGDRYGIRYDELLTFIIAYL